MIDPATADVLAALRTNQFTFFTGVPTTYHKLVQAAAGKVGPSVSSLRVCVTAGAPSTPELYPVERVLGVPLLNGYGSTETCGGVATSRPEGPLVAGACGPPLTGLDIRFTDPASGLDVPPGDEGEIWVRGPSLMLGYHNQPEATAAVLRDGWYRTGDLGRLVQHDQVAVTGRIKELIIRGGEDLHPAEVEEVLLSCPEVVDAVVVASRTGCSARFRWRTWRAHQTASIRACCCPPAANGCRAGKCLRRSTRSRRSPAHRPARSPDARWSGCPRPGFCRQQLRAVPATAVDADEQLAIAAMACHSRADPGRSATGRCRPWAVAGARWRRCGLRRGGGCAATSRAGERRKRDVDGRATARVRTLN
jgi:acyl-CoA synthetase (AMP-forming)/AMP-acid ligase II